MYQMEGELASSLAAFEEKQRQVENDAKAPSSSKPVSSAQRVSVFYSVLRISHACYSITCVDDSELYIGERGRVDRGDVGRVGGGGGESTVVCAMWQRPSLAAHIRHSLQCPTAANERRSAIRA